MRRQEPEQLTSFWSLTDKRSTFARHCSNDNGWPWLCSIFSGTKGKLSHFGCPQKGCTRNTEKQSSGLSSFFHSFPITNGNFGIPTYIRFLDTHTYVGRYPNPELYSKLIAASITQIWCFGIFSSFLILLAIPFNSSFVGKFHWIPTLLVIPLKSPFLRVWLVGGLEHEWIIFPY